MGRAGAQRATNRPPARAHAMDGAGGDAWVSLTVVSLGLFLAVMSTTAVSVALPTLGRDFHADPTQLEWVVDAYVVVYASLLVAGGALGDRLGRKGLFLAGVAMFGCGSLVAGLAPSIEVLLVGRVLQGVGPAVLVPGSLTIIRTVFTEPRQRAVAIGLWSTSSGLALAVGPPVGGLLVAGLGWPAVFWFNTPLAAAVVVRGARFLPRLPSSQTAGRFDWPAAATISAAIALLDVGVIHGQDHGWGTGAVLAAFAAGGAALVGFVVVERRRADPMIDVYLFTSYRFTVANLAAFVVFFAFVGVIVYFSAYFQQVQHHSAIRAGMDLAAIGVAYATATVVSGRFVGAVGERWPMLAGLVIAGLATLRADPPAVRHGNRRHLVETSRYWAPASG
jgi:DHA2 family methylenomycin A resistance protein-like MFS transporter